MWSAIIAANDAVLVRSTRKSCRSGSAPVPVVDCQKSYSRSGHSGELGFHKIDCNQDPCKVYWNSRPSFRQASSVPDAVAMQLEVLPANLIHFHAVIEAREIGRVFAQLALFAGRHVCANAMPFLIENGSDRDGVAEKKISKFHAQIMQQGFATAKPLFCLPPHFVAKGTAFALFG